MSKLPLHLLALVASPHSFNHILCIIDQYGLFLSLLGELEDRFVPYKYFILQGLDFRSCLLSSVEKLTFLIIKTIKDSLVFLDCLLVEVYELGDILTDRVGQDEFATQTVTLIELASESCKLSHDLDVVTLRLGMLKLNFVFLSEFLIQLCLKARILLKSDSQLDFIFLDNTTADLLVNGLPVWTQILLNKSHAGGILFECTGW